MNTLQICLPHLSDDDVATLRRKTQKSHFSTLLFIYFGLFTNSTNSNCCTAALAVYLLLFSAFCYLHSPSTATGARYSRSACIETSMLRLAAAACCDMGWTNTRGTWWCTLPLSSVEKDWKRVLMQKVITLNTCCDIAHSDPAPAAGLFFQSHRGQPTTGSLQSLQCLKERNEPSMRWKSFAVDNLLLWHFHVGLASGLDFVFLFWYICYSHRSMNE